MHGDALKRGPWFRCAGCEVLVGAVAYPFRCPAARAGDDLDHLVVPVPPDDARWPGPASAGAPDQPFIRYRSLLSAWRLALSRGFTDDDYLQLADELDAAVTGVDGHGFIATPFLQQPALASRLGVEGGGERCVKDETGNVSGSHKARHLFGVMLYLLVAERAGILANRPPLAIASCGNAALAAAVVARAADWPLDVFVPPAANDVVLARLESLGARITTCQRQAGVAGDPCYLSFKAAVANGALPFCCQGSDNGLTIEGGETLAWEMVEQLGAGRGQPFLASIFVQVGGGALASAVIQGFGVACRMGLINRVPSLFTVQTAGAYPLARACEAVAERARRTGVDEALAYARTHRSQFMWPWEQEPRSIAHGILDDETYDWAAVVEGMIRTGGRPVVVDEARLRDANTLARSLTGIDVDHTGSAGLAGLIDALRGEPARRRARVAVIFSGIRRSA